MPDFDALYRRLFTHAVLVEHLIRAFVPEVLAAGIDFTRMELFASDFPTGKPGKGRERRGDVVWCLPTRSGTDLLVYVMFEFQSKIDWWMAVRAQVYQGLLFQAIVAARKLKTGDRLPPVLVIVLYNGTPRWAAPTTTTELIALTPGSPLAPWQPRARYHLLDMGAAPAADLGDETNLATLLTRLERGPSFAEFEALVAAIVAWFVRHPGYDQLRDLFAEMARVALETIAPTASVPHDLQRVETMLATLGETWIEQWKAEERAEMIVRLLRRRFGALPPEFEQRILGADLDQLDVWADRLLDVPSPEALFDDP